MLKLVCLAVIVNVAAVAAQGNNQLMTYMMLSQMMNQGGSSPSGAVGAASSGSGSGAASNPAAAAAVLSSMGRGGSSLASMFGGGGSGSSGSGGRAGIMGMINNPMLMCRQTENFRPIPCRNTPDICNFESIRQYNLPNLLTCSPMGFGCCIKDAMTLMFINRHA